MANTRAERVKIVCLECGEKFATTNLCPSCPKCGGSDIDVRMESNAHTAYASSETAYGRTVGYGFAVKVF